MNKTTIGIIYDFDKTLCTKDMQEYDFIKNLEIEPSEFWGEAAKVTDEFQMDKVLAYMYVMIKKCKEKGIKLTEEYLAKCGENVVLYKGVISWFDRINQYCESLGVNVEHYIISSGTYEIIKGTPIAKYFKQIFACRFMYNENDEAIWPSLAINYTLKTQYIFRINKGILDVTDDDSVNRHATEESRRIPYRNMIYIGDGFTDIPCMKLLKQKGGKAIALYPPKNAEKVKAIVEEERINYVCAADYSENSALEKIVKLMIENMSVLDELKYREEKQLKQFLKNSK